MTAATDITVKKADGTTSILWSLLTGSGGDKSPAVWRSGTATGTLGQKPMITVQSRWNAAGTVRRVDVEASFPSTYTDTSTSLTSVRSKATMKLSFAFPQDMLAADMSEAAAQIANLVASPLLVGAFASGYAPT